MLNRFFKLDPVPLGKPAQIYVGWMTSRCLPAMAEIDRPSFDNPWSREDFTTLLKDHGNHGTVVYADETLIGYAIYGLRVGMIDLLRFAVRPAWCRRKIGATVVSRLIARLDEHGRDAIGCHVPETNDAAVAFLVSLGFRAVGVDRGYFGDRDAYRMAWRLRWPEGAVKGPPRHPGAAETLTAIEGVDAECGEGQGK